MAPIRIALIGLSQSAKTSWASEGHLPYLLSERGRERYEITALLNSSVEAAKRAIEGYQLPSSTKAYGSPQDVANDPDIDLVVCSTRVDIHYDTVKPSLAAGKAVFVEWPLAENTTRAAELAKLAKDSGSPTIIGLQARVAPPVLKIKQILESGQLGKVLSSSIQAFSPYGGGHSISEGLAYFLDKKVGGNPITIAAAHMIDYVHSVLGEYVTSHSHTQIQRPDMKIVNRDTGETRPWTSDVPDLLSVHGTLQESAHVARDASLVVSFRTGAPFAGTKPFVWTISCEKGEIRASSQRGPNFQSEAGEQAIPIEIEDYASGTVRQVEWSWEDWQLPLLARGRSIAKLYDLYAQGQLAEHCCADFDSAVNRHRQIDEFLHVA